MKTIGNYLSVVHTRASTRLAIHTLGVIDLHSHSRLRPLLDYFDAVPADGSLAILEVGCGDGVNLFELYRRRTVTAVGYDLSASAIERAKRINALCFDSAIEFYCDDVTDLSVSGTHDYVLCMDILEHLEDPKHLLLTLDSIIRPGGCLVISVPTTRYPEVFGQEFNTAIGHLMDGYTLSMLDATVPDGFTRVKHRYSTGRLASIGCALYYRVAMRIPRNQSRLAVQIALLALFKWFDPFNGPKSSCSLFAVYEKRT